MGYPDGIGAIDLMIGFPFKDKKATYDYLRAGIKDAVTELRAEIRAAIERRPPLFEPVPHRFAERAHAFDRSPRANGGPSCQSRNR